VGVSSREVGAGVIVGSGVGEAWVWRAATGSGVAEGATSLAAGVVEGTTAVDCPPHAAINPEIIRANAPTTHLFRNRRVELLNMSIEISLHTVLAIIHAYQSSTSVGSCNVLKQQLVRF
jgi:hypothetical protein